ncbi:hypothetical protein QJS04_geneDACA015565 [Acorus gramineus]|uniref:Uncharacterized protein n=1 Tax=Acorus gramineus TaxID=55184 RepID=A0AAV9ARB9_ACOGR|nr:hypothetical protein QJS04_geneDACA015565 [Acorus gramineus]
MVNLFLLSEEPKSTLNEDVSTSKERISLLARLESILWSLITSSSCAGGGRYEARLWLCQTISSAGGSLDPRDSRELFLGLLRSDRPNGRAVAGGLLRLIFERRPRKAGSVIARRGPMVEKFFRGNPQRIMEWFDNFAPLGETEHRKGARALSQYAFINRETCWEELEWKGKHGQSPAIVATKPHYFHDLDLLQTVENFLEYVPDFWTSDELAETLKDGEILHLDMKFFMDEFVSMMYDDDSGDIWELVDEYLLEEEFSYLSQHLLILLDESQLLDFIKSVHRFLPTGMQHKDFCSSSYWLGFLLTCDDFISMDELLFSNAVINQRRQLVRLICDEENEAEKEQIDKLLITGAPLLNEDLWDFMKECLRMKRHVAVKWLVIQSWVLHYSMLKECRTVQSWESLFVKNGISFRRSGDYSFVGSDEILEGSGSDCDKSPTRARQRKRDKRRKKRRKHYHDDYSDDGLMALNASDRCSQVGVGNWSLSTDGYASVWDAADLPEHLSSISLSSWMTWLCSKWNSVS